MPDEYRYQYIGDRPINSPEYGWEGVQPGDVVTAREEVNHPDLRLLKEGEKPKGGVRIRRGELSSSAAENEAVEEARQEDQSSSAGSVAPETTVKQPTAEESKA